MNNGQFYVPGANMLGHGLNVHFELRTVQSKNKTREAGRPIFEDIPFIVKRIPGDVDVVERPASEKDRHEFANEWVRFEKSMEQSPDGMPLLEWGQMARSQAEEYRCFGISTVEQLASVSDAMISKCPIRSINRDRRRARDWLEMLSNTSAMEKFSSAIDEKDREISALKANLQVAEARIADLEKQVLAVQMAQSIAPKQEQQLQEKPAPVQMSRPVCVECGRQFGRAMKPENHPERCLACDSKGG